jgi:hypothetical protein
MTFSICTFSGTDIRYKTSMGEKVEGVDTRTYDVYT